MKIAKVYVTTDRIIVNRRSIPFYWRVHILEAFVIALAPFLPNYTAPLILIAVAIAITIILLRRRTLRNRPWPSVLQVQRGRRVFEAEKGKVLSIELKMPKRFRTGLLSITSISSETFHGKIQRGKSFTIAKDVMLRFDQQRVRFVE